MKNWLKILLTGLSVALLSLSLLLLFLPSLLKPLLNSGFSTALNYFGIQNSEIEVSHFSWHRLTVRSLSVPLPDGSLFALENLSLSYSPGQLISGELNTLELDVVSLNLADETGEKLAGAAAAGAGKAATNVIETTPEVAIPAFKQWLQLPLESLSIHQINIQHASVSTALQAQVTPQLWRVWGDAQLDNIPLPWQLEMQLQNSGDLLIMLSESSQLLTQLYGNIDQDEAGNTHIILNQQSDLKAINERLLTDLPVHIPLTTMQSRSEIQLPPVVMIPNGIDLTSEITVETDAGPLLTGSQSTKSQSTSQQPTNPQPDLTLHWQSGEITAAIQKAADAPLSLQVFSQHKIKADVAGQSYLIQQQNNQPLLTTSCNIGLTGCQLQSLLSWNINTDQQQANITLKPELEWQQEKGVSGFLIAGIDAEQNNPAWPQGQFSSQGRFDFSLQNNGDWQLTSEHGLRNTLALEAITLKPTDSAPDEKESDKNAATQTIQRSELTRQRSELQVSELQLTLLDQLDIKHQQQVLSFEPLRVALKPFSAELSEQLSSRQTSVATVNITNSSVECLPQITRNLSNHKADIHCQLSLASTPSNFQQWPIPDMSIRGPLNLTLPLEQETSQPQASDKPTVIDAELVFSLADQALQLRSHIKHEQQAGAQLSSGSMQWQLQDTPLNWNALGLSELTNLTKLQLLNGSLSGQGWLDWQQTPDQQWQLKPDFMLRFDELAATYDNSISLENWRGLFAIRRPLNFTGTDSDTNFNDYIIDAQIAGESVNTGIQLSNILARSQTRIPADLSSALIEVYEVHTELLGGRVRLPLMKFDTRKDVNAFGIEVDNIQLSELAKLEPNAEVEATGVLDGVLPIVITQAGVQIPGGNLFARDPGGVIRYNNATSQALKSSDQTVGLAMQLLEDFHYNQLESGVEYQPDGELNLALQFQGNNPEFFGGQATHLNVNLDYNLLDLLESLRISNDLIQKVEEKYQL
ncbi:YdbH domain-containing protein [Bacterioplanoides sp. SCSIO 12839]|uniref:YdbH domain-containing protein n=1 Tax=Bacterioplanoides sp. SCSIO 12839 TaxID=2829569 RepID=UPI002102C508|nr:YdbH domain-containing protein [Bacterioplanoides sp. SCSIO 12839]UTW48452.1 YdbH domain-containing protein [Bacterioplanoides sp. SCSIO 12839]